MSIFPWAARKTRNAVVVLKAAVDATAYYGSMAVVLRKTLRILRTEGFGALLQRAKILMHVVSHRGGRVSVEDPNEEFFGKLPARDVAYYPKISIIVPNYNHDKYLTRRLNSIYSQTYQNIEVILMDDCSLDGSIETLVRYKNLYPEITRLELNENNSGSVFNQWRKGFSLASGELVWIAESDDFCDDSFLEQLVRFFQNSAVMLAFCRSDFVDGETESPVWTSEDFLSDIDRALWKQPFVRSANWLVNFGWGVKNIIPNVSSALMRHPGRCPLLDDEEWRRLKLCGDWIFYLEIMRGGLVGYTPLVTNSYRQHVANTSVQAQKTDAYYREHEYVARSLISRYKLSEDVLIRQSDSLYLHWCRWRGEKRGIEFQQLYSVDRARLMSSKRLPNLLIATYSLVAGGGETFPIILANQLKLKGWPVTLFNCNVIKTVPGVRQMLASDVPLLEIDAIHHIGPVCKNMGIEIVHSHHAWVDVTLAECIIGPGRPKQVITLHGMYELIEKDRIGKIVEILRAQISVIVYTAEKNILPFPGDFLKEKKATRISNALNIVPLGSLDRSKLSIAAEDFVVCLISRAVPEKGWEEAITAVELATVRSTRKIHLILVGDGPEHSRLMKRASDVIHFVGYQPRIRDYFAMADMGLLPSRFVGESYPLVLIDCLSSDRPMLASNVGEIFSMLVGSDGLAGEVFDLVEGQIDVELLADRIEKIANDPATYDSMKAQVASAVLKFDPVVMANKYEQVYNLAVCE